MWTYTYDAAGDVVKRSKGAASDTWVYTYDNDNRMLTAAYSATDGGAVTQRVTYSYDAFGDRIERDAWDGTTTTTERYALDGWDTAKPTPVGNEDFDTWAVLDGSNALVNQYVSGPNFDEHVAKVAADGTISWYAADYQGSVRLVLDNSGLVSGTTAYDAFGNVTAGNVPDYGYAGYRLDQITTFYSTGNGEREYIPQDARFAQPDRLGVNAGPDPYTYVSNRVTTATDPSGRWLIVPDGQIQKWKDSTGLPLDFVPYGNVAGQPASIMQAPRTNAAHATIAGLLRTSGKLDERSVQVAMIALYGGHLDGPLQPGGDLQDLGLNRYFSFPRPEPRESPGFGSPDPLGRVDRDLLRYQVNMPAAQRADIKSVLSTDKFDKIDRSVVDQWVAAGAAERIGKRGSAEYVVVSLPDLGTKLVLRENTKLTECGYGEVSTLAVTSADTYSAVAVHGIHYSNTAIRQGLIDIPNAAQLYNSLDLGLTFGLHMLPGGTQADYLALNNGTKLDLAMATVGDVGMFLTLGGSKLFALGRKAGNIQKAGLGVTLSITGLHMQGPAIILNIAEGIKAAKDGDGRAVAGHAGQLVLHLVVLRSGAKKLVPEVRVLGAIKAPKKIPGQGYHKETTSPKPVKAANVTAEQQAFLGPGPYTNIHPRTGVPDPTRIVSADGKRSIRYGDHEKASAGTTKHHYHEETWTYDPVNDVMNVDNVIRRIQAPPPPKPPKTP